MIRSRMAELGCVIAFLVVAYLTYLVHGKGSLILLVKVLVIAFVFFFGFSQLLSPRRLRGKNRIKYSLNFAFVAAFFLTVIGGFASIFW